MIKDIQIENIYKLSITFSVESTLNLVLKMRIKDWFYNKKDIKFVACIDTCFIEGTFLKLIEREHWKIEIKEDKRLKDLNWKELKKYRPS